jgi:hypothetical protein
MPPAADHGRRDGQQLLLPEGAMSASQYQDETSGELTPVESRSCSKTCRVSPFLRAANPGACVISGAATGEGATV